MDDFTGITVDPLLDRHPLNLVAGIKPRNAHEINWAIDEGFLFVFKT